VNISGFFIDRPIFAAVVSIMIFTAGLIAIPLLPIAEYPDVVPPTVQVRALYPGANPKVIAETVASPLEEAINGVENMIYLKSVASSDGVLLTTVTFRSGTDIDLAQVQVQNRVSQALARLPEDVRLLGVTTQKKSPNLTMVVHVLSPGGRYDAIYLRNYVVLHIRDELARIPGVGDAQVFGAGDYSMRIWLDPDKVAARGLAAGDIVRAIREQNVQVSAGELGAPPQRAPTDFTVLINAQGRLVDEAEFGDIVLKVGTDGEPTRLRDVARVELGAAQYALRSLLDNQQAIAIPIFQAPGSNAIAVSNRVRATMAELASGFAEGITWKVVYDPTIFVRDSIRAVLHTLFEAVLLVVLVVILFLQTWRASVIPLLAVPVSIVGTFAVLLLLGFSINTLTLFGLVLAIGIVVDDAIVVVENIERNVTSGLTPTAAAHRAMSEVSGPIVAIALVLVAVFVPMSLLSGVTGQFYRQFAVTIAISTVISAINSLTLSPALSATLLQLPGSRSDAVTRLLNRLFGGFFRGFNTMFHRGGERYSHGVTVNLGRRGLIYTLYGGLIALTALGIWTLPGGFIPIQDKAYLLGVLKMPEGSSLDRTEAMMRRMTDIALRTDGVASAVEFPGLNALQFTNTPNSGAFFFGLKPFDQRQRAAEAIAGELTGKFFALQEGMGFAIMPPPIIGLGNGSGISLYLEDRAGLGYGQLQSSLQMLSGGLAQTPGMRFPVSTYQANVPQFDVSVDRTKAKAEGIGLNDLFETLQVYLGSIYVNDFNRFGRTYQVFVQADAPFRNRVETVRNLRTRNSQGDMVPIGSVLTLKQAFGPDPVLRYNGYPAADVLGQADPRVLSSSQAMAATAALAEKLLPRGITLEWTDLSFQQATEGRANVLAFPLAVMLAFLVLAALYESWTQPLAVILIVPLCVLSAVWAVYFSGGDNNIFVQIGLVVLMGLASKNAILIVEFARELELRGRTPPQAAVEACRIRLRPIVMTSVAFIAGVTPLVLSVGAGAEIRRVMGLTVFAGMIGVTLFGLMLTPIFYVGLSALRRKRAKRDSRDDVSVPAGSAG